MDRQSLLKQFEEEWSQMRQDYENGIFLTHEEVFNLPLSPILNESKSEYNGQHIH